MAAIVSTIILATAAGAWAELRYGGRAAIAARRALIFALYVVLPPTTFFNLARVQFDADIGLGIGLAYLALALAALIAWFVASRLLGLGRPAVGSVICCTLVANTGYLGYPLVAALLGFDRLSEAVIYNVLVSAPALLVGAFSVGAAFGERAGETPRERVVAFFVRNPPLYAAALALIAP
ncbi:MAG TPA: transporter, partial [Solirubrobacterales bacterium]|nr:transporter [Solirubrobacterales bacterium]